MPARDQAMQHQHLNNGTASAGDQVVISGVSGRLPESAGIEEFSRQLFAGVDLVTDDTRRWPAAFHGLPTRTGKLKDLAHFDAAFFGVHPKQADNMDPQMKMLLESTYEAIVDAGMNPGKLRGTRTGVYIGISDSEAQAIWTGDLDAITGYELTGCTRSMMANRISYTFDFKGPSYALDTACSSSIIAMENAISDLRSGTVDYAVVGGSNLLIKPSNSIQFLRLSMVNKEGTCKAFDASGNGYVRSEAIVVILMQRVNTANRVYATVVGSGVNTDGAKEQGITFPSGDMQNRLIKEVYAKAGVDPADVSYVEAHGTGTKVGDPQEINSIADAFCKNNRKAPLLIGSVKSNMGHSEPASGLCSIAKILIGMEAGMIPGNLHYNTPNPDIPALVDGRIKVVAKNEPWNGGLIGMNSFGFGGANGHVILKSNPKPKTTWEEPQTPRLITVSGRTEEAITHYFNKIEENKYDEELLALIDQIHSENIHGHNYRGYKLFKKDGTEETSMVTSDKRPIWFVFAGMGSQWPGMGKSLMNFEPFRNSIKRSAETLRPFGINLEDILINGDEETLENVRNSFVSIGAIQIALVDTLKLLKIEPDGIIGHSIGEVGCAYADGTLTPEQAILLSYSRGTAILETKLATGAMAAVGLTWDECKSMCPPDVFPVCHNSPNSVTVSGPPAQIDSFLEQLTKKEIFNKKVNSAGYAFHSKYIADAGPKLRKALDKLIPAPKMRSSRWVSSSIPESAWNTPLAQQSSPAYHVNNLLSPVYFHEAVQHIPENAIVLELAPHALMQAILKRSLPKTVTNIGLLKRGHPDSVSYFLSNIGKLYNAGGQPDIAAMYPSVSFPVSKGTPMINSMVKWDHSNEWRVPYFGAESKSGEMIVDVDLSKDEYKYLAGHTIDGRILFPATGYMTLAWKSFAKLRNEDYEQLPVVFENVRFMRATIMPKDGSVKFLVNIFEGTGEFEICEAGSVAVTGRIYVPENVDREFLKLPEMKKPAGCEKLLDFKKEDVYKELRLRGYDYDGLFRGIEASDNYGKEGKLKWEDNWVSFIDTMLQFTILGNDSRALRLPTRLQRGVINPVAHKELNATIDVRSYCNIGAVKAGGIELRGLEATAAPRRQQTQPPPKLEKYQFIPLEGVNVPVSSSIDDAENKAIYNTLSIATHLVIENSAGALKLKIVEVVDEPENVLTPKLQNIVETEPMMHVENVIITPKQMKVELDCKIQVKDVTKGSFEQNAHMIVLKNAINNPVVIQNALASLKPAGFLLFVETASVDTSNLQNLNLTVVNRQTVKQKTYILTRQIVEMDKSATILHITETNFNWVEPLKEALKQSEATNKKVYLVCQGEEHAGLVGMMTCVKQEAGGVNFRAVFIQDGNAEPFSLTSNYYATQLQKDLVSNVLKNGVWGTYRHVALDHNATLPTLQVEHAYVNTITRGDLASLKWIEGPLRYHAQQNEHQDLCTVYYAALNFKDIMLATGKLSTDSLPKNVAKQDCVLGFEFVGRDSQGRRVMGMTESRAIATTVVADKRLLWEVPEKWSLEEASTVPVVYATAYYSLIVRGKMQPGESILIHAGTGGVGLASIAVALHMNCRVFTTVSTQAKRDFLKKTFPQLTDECIGYSRDTSFEQFIMEATGGRGVNLVLNSLAGEQLLASVRCLSMDGRFLEIGKFDLQNNSSLGMSMFLKNTSFHGILVDSLLETMNPDCQEMHRLVTEGIKNGAVRPLPPTVFEDSQVEQAFRFMASGKHIGKVVLKLRAEEGRQTVMPKHKTIAALPKSYMDPSKVYILVGGLGGFGLELTNWLVTRGAKKILLSSRSGVKTGYQSLCIRRWRSDGAEILISTADVTSEAGAKKLLDEAGEIGAIGGIFNLAAVLRDALMENQSVDDFKTVCRPKIDGTKQLDKVSRELAPHLDYFVVFSSVSCGRGNAGQVNYGYANSAMERICESRQAAGLPALAIQWGAIGDVGLVLEQLAGMTEVGGTLLQNISSCLASMDIFLQQPLPVVSSFVLAEKGHKKSGGNEVKLTEAVANILGIKDVKTVPQITSLADLGMDSLMGAEIKQTLERTYDVILNAQEIRLLTFGRLIELESNTSEAPESPVKETQKDLVQFGDQIMPTKPIVEMPSKTTTSKKNPIFIVHPIEGVVTSLKTLAKEIDAPVYGLQCTKNAPLSTIADLAKHYTQEVRRVQSKGPYVLIGYSFGAAVAFEMGVQLESTGEKVKVLFIDGSPEYVAMHTGKAKEHRIKAGNVTEEQSGALMYFIAQFTDVDTQKLYPEMMAMKTWEERLKRTTEIVTQATQFPPEQISEAAESFYHKLVAADKYKPTSTLKGDVILVKAVDNIMQFGEDYGLQKVCKQNVVVKSLDGNHRTILRNPQLFEVANSLC